MRNRELVAALVVVMAITAGYAAAVGATGVPGSADAVGHGLGILGLSLMIFTEVGYSLRKRSAGRVPGTMRAWLQVHIVCGIVGPYLVLLHTAWRFNGLAGALTVMVLIVVISGFIGRYIYTAVPRTADGAVLEAAEIGRLLEEARSRASTVAQAGPTGDRRASREEREARRRLRELERQLAALRWARRALATWHTIHIPIGMAMFVTAGIHVVASLYYATLSR
jgi:hypothetical protein